MTLTPDQQKEYESYMKSTQQKEHESYMKLTPIQKKVLITR